MNREDHNIYVIGELRRQYLRDIEPLIKQKIRIMSCTIPKYVLHHDGHIETVEQLSDVSKQTIALIDQCINEALAKTNKQIEYYL